MYFAKYLPVEGEIKKDDTYSYEGKVMIAPMDLTKGTGSLTPDRQKVKLFLCSRAIQVGDEVNYLITGEKRKVLSFEQAQTVSGTGKNGWCDLTMAKDEKFHVKIIGEISPDALSFVNEGDEFTEDQVKKYFICYAPEPGEFCFHCSRSQTCDSEEYNYLIKGPCGHFH